MDYAQDACYNDFIHSDKLYHLHTSAKFMGQDTKSLYSSTLPNMVNNTDMLAHITKQNQETVTTNTEHKLLKLVPHFSKVMLTTVNVTVRAPSFIPVVAPIMKSKPITPPHFQ
jgi:hypothetical protein